MNLKSLLVKVELRRLDSVAGGLWASEVNEVPSAVPEAVIV